MPTYSIKFDQHQSNFALEEPPFTIPVYHNDRKIALAVLDQTGYSFNLPHSLSYLVQIDCAVPTLFYSGPDGPSPDNYYEKGQPESIVLVRRPQVPQPSLRIKVRAHASHL